MTASEARSHGDELIAARHFDAAPACVWEAFTAPTHLAAFWGGHHATVRPASVVVDLRVGGTFELEMVGADGAGRPLHFRYEAVDPPTRLVLSEPRTGITTEIRIEPRGRGTDVTVRQRRLPPELRSEQARVGLAAVLQRLGDVLATVTPTGSKSA